MTCFDPQHFFLLKCCVHIYFRVSINFWNLRGKFNKIVFKNFRPSAANASLVEPRCLLATIKAVHRFVKISFKFFRRLNYVNRSYKCYLSFFSHNEHLFACSLWSILPALVVWWCWEYLTSITHDTWLLNKLKQKNPTWRGDPEIYIPK